MKIEKQRQTERKIESRKKWLMESFIQFILCMLIRGYIIANIYAINFRLSGGKLWLFYILPNSHFMQVDKRTHTCDIETIHFMLLHSTIRKLLMAQNGFMDIRAKIQSLHFKIYMLMIIFQICIYLRGFYPTSLSSSSSYKVFVCKREDKTHTHTQTHT